METIPTENQPAQPLPQAKESPIIPEITPKKQKLTFIILGIFVVLLICTGAFFVIKSLGKPMVAPQPQITPISTPTPDPTTQWHTYVNNLLKFTIKYPSDYSIEKGSTDNNVHLCKPLEYEGACVGIRETKLSSDEFEKELIDGYQSELTKTTTTIGGQEVTVFLPTNPLGMGNRDHDHIYVPNPINKLNLDIVFDYSDVIQNQILSTIKFLELSTNIFNYETIKVGDQIGDMTAISIKPFESLSPISAHNYVVLFKGPVTIAGKYFQLGPNEMISERIGACFNDLEEKSLDLLPQEADEAGSPWFCFNNSELADKEFPAGTGKATIVIDNYSVNIFPSEVWNSATLVKVISKE